jgi:hypothetical protein
VSDQLFIVLRVCLLALVYLVFLRVLRAVWVELRADGAESALPTPRRATRRRAARPAPPRPVPAPTPSPATASSGAVRPPAGAARLVVVAPPSMAGHAFAIDGETTIGRGAGCGVAIDASHVSKLHARLFPRDGSWFVEDLGSTNGTAVDGHPVTMPTPIAAGGRIAIGDIVMELT